MKLKSMNHVLAAINRCDVILKNGQEQFVGLYYDEVNFDRPIVLFKCDWALNYYLAKALELMPVQCVEHKPLTRALFEYTKEGDYIDVKYMNAVATIYSNLDKFKNHKDKEDFDEELYNDVTIQLYQLESVVCKRAEKKFLIKEAKKIKVQSSAAKPLEFIQTAIPKIAEETGFDYRVIHNASKGTYEFYMETILDEYDFDLWVMAMVSMPDQKIYVGNRCLFRNFELSETALAVEYIKVLIKTSNEELRKEVKTFCDEFEINPRLFDITKNSIKTMLEMNYNYSGIEYGINDSMKTQVMVYLQDINDNAKMFEVCITYNEFSRNPDAFKKFIEEPKVQKKWNFWSRRKKYNQKYFDEKFQTIEQ
ncbi:FlhB HrpN YscU SpaS Family [Treponema bryantii]|uniref:FlhB HrpN YscU SpaS Family n=1 Tax=Treponema bryantii TaxID=163 RepID=A0A1I3LJ22_9SPIR|nr:EscU/YscU/HrcU family type III secretion system export apparatus switch protein [Treponema bryantii]SFI84748.1 FlhB HrpN YscU SpaS Family [Treponema bryantii]